MKITENGRAVCGIVLPEKPTPREIFAAEELAGYIGKISGAEITLSDEYKYSIIIGDPSRNKAAQTVMSIEEFDARVPGPEGFIIKSAKNYLLLAGSSNHPGEQERGTIYAVYEFLERFLGCSFAVYSKSSLDAGEFIPKMTDIAIGNETYIKKCADVGYRTAIIQYDFWVCLGGCFEMRLTF